MTSDTISSAAEIAALYSRSPKDMESEYRSQNDGTYAGWSGTPSDRLSVTDGAIGLRHTTGAEYLLSYGVKSIYVQVD